MSGDQSDILAGETAGGPVLGEIGGSCQQSKVAGGLTEQQVLGEAGDWPLLAGALLKHVARHNLAFHMPGHKQGRGAWKQWRQLLGEAVFSLDLTELPGLDNLQDPKGVIRDACGEAACYFGADQTYFLVNGATSGLLAVLLTLCQPGDQVLLPRNCHQSVVNGLILNGANPFFVPVHSHPSLGLPGMMTTDDLRQALERREVNSRNLVLLNPNYYGLAGDLAGQIELAHAGGMRVLVDEAHGAHFVTSSRFPRPALHCGADFVAQGAHKVLGAFTQAAYLHRRGYPQLADKLLWALRVVNSSSPSYLLMASLDVARRQCQESEAAWDETAERCLCLRQQINRIEGLQALGDQLLEVPGVVAYDPTRLVVRVSGLGITGFVAADWLAERGIMVEMADYNNLVLIIVPADRELLEQLLTGLRSLADAYVGSSRSAGTNIGRSYPDPMQLAIPRQLMSPRVAFFSTQSKVPLAEAKGRLAAEVVAPYPPGVPVLCPGEVITDEVIEFLTAWQVAGGNWPGGGEGTISVVGGYVVGGEKNADHL